MAHGPTGLLPGLGDSQATHLTASASLSIMHTGQLQPHVAAAFAQMPFFGAAAAAASFLASASLASAAAAVLPNLKPEAAGLASAAPDAAVAPGLGDSQATHLTASASLSIMHMGQLQPVGAAAFAQMPFLAGAAAAASSAAGSAVSAFAQMLAFLGESTFTAAAALSVAARLVSGTCGQAVGVHACACARNKGTPGRSLRPGVRGGTPAAQ